MSGVWSGPLLPSPLSVASITVPVTGVSATVYCGYPLPGIEITGVTATGDLGNVTTHTVVNAYVSGVSCTGEVSTLPNSFINPTGVTASTGLSDIGVSLGEGIVVEVSGVSTTFMVNQTTLWGEIPNSIRGVWTDL